MKKYILGIVLVLLFSVETQASPLTKLWEKSFESTLLNGCDVNIKGRFGFVSSKTLTILDKDGTIILNKPNIDKDRIITMSEKNFVLQNGGDGKPSSARVYSVWNFSP